MKAILIPIITLFLIGCSCLNSAEKERIKLSCEEWEEKCLLPPYSISDSMGLPTRYKASLVKVKECRKEKIECLKVLNEDVCLEKEIEKEAKEEALNKFREVLNSLKEKSQLSDEEKARVEAVVNSLKNKIQSEEFSDKDKAILKRILTQFKALL